MSVEVLQTKSEIATAREQMRGLNIDCKSPSWLRWAVRLRLSNSIIIGEFNKSWDVFKTVSFLKTNLAPGDPILDIGAHTSETLFCLHRLGFSRLTGVDLNPGIMQMPHAGEITYIRSDFMHMPVPDSSFSAVTAISVIEHGFQPDRLLAELSRVLKPGGFFIASVDYWPEKISTSGIRAYSMDWRIFSEEELKSFIVRAKAFGFSPVGEIRPAASDRVITWMGKHYTFAWMTLRKKQ